VGHVELCVRTVETHDADFAVVFAHALMELADGGAEPTSASTPVCWRGPMEGGNRSAELCSEDEALHLTVCPLALERRDVSVVRVPVAVFVDSSCSVIGGLERRLWAPGALHSLVSRSLCDLFAGLLGERAGASAHIGRCQLLRALPAQRKERV